MGEKRIDPVLVSVLQRRLESICVEMAFTLLKTTRSPIFNEARDFVTGLYDAKGQMLAQAEYIPVLAMSVPYAAEHIINYFGEELYPGDVIIHNDVFSKGNQLTDVAIFRPIFYKDKFVAIACCKGHVADIGGAFPGGYNPTATEVWQEGIRIPPVKIYEKGKLRKDVWDFIFANIRFPFVADDIRAEIGGTVIGERGIIRLLDRYGLDTVEQHIEAMYDSTEEIVRKRIEAMPDGVYTGECSMYWDGQSEGEWTVRVTITISGSEITFDFSKSSPRAKGYINQPYASFMSAVWIALFMFLGVDVPHNAGITRPVHVINPEGSFINAPKPAATVLGNHITTIVTHAITRALAEALPDRAFAGWFRDCNTVSSGIDPRTNEHFVDIGFILGKGGGGAVYEADGYNHIGIIACCGGNLAQDPEMLEYRDPWFLEYFEYDQDSAGAGCWRGGLGTYGRIKLYSPSSTISVLGTGNTKKEEPFGLFGAKAGSLSKIKYTFPDGTQKECKSIDSLPSVPSGTIWEQWTSGGGGFGDPYLAPAEKVLEGVRNEIISIKSAKEDYGVVIEGDVEHPSSLKINWQETNTVRGSRPIVPLPEIPKR